MRNAASKCLALLLAFLFAAGLFAPGAYAADEAVTAVIAQLEAIDTLQEMQANRYTYKATGRYDVLDSTYAQSHETARAGYETYVAEMLAARVAAQQAYNALTAAQQAQIDPALTAKLSEELSTVFYPTTASLTPRYDAYTFETAYGAFGYAYEVSNHMVFGNIPQIFVLVNTADGSTSWSPNGLYSPGVSNYDVAYCSDVHTGLGYGVHYKRINLEDSSYYGPAAAKKIRAILQYSYPFVTVEQMKANLKAGGLAADFVDSLTRADLIAAVQAAVWTYANAGETDGEAVAYFASIDIPKNIGSYYTPMHDYTNESWEWFPGKGQRTYDARAEYRVNTLIYYLCSLPGVEPADDQIVISSVEVTRADLVPEEDGTYSVGMYVHLNHSGSESDNLTVTVSSIGTGADGTAAVTDQTAQTVHARSKLSMSVRAHAGDTILVTVDGTQILGRGVYFYEPEGGRDTSQNLVGVGSGATNVRDEMTFTFNGETFETGLRIYKTAASTGLPLSEIVFHIYRVVPEEGTILNDVPSAEELALYCTAENLVGSVTTDETGYASLGLDEGIYLVAEEYNAEKVLAPVDPFFITVPMYETTTNEDGTAVVETVNIPAVYPKNEPVPPLEFPPPIPPTPQNVTGQFQILKYDARDSANVLSGAEFAVYRAAATAEEATDTVMCGGVMYAVAPVLVDGVPLVLTTDDSGSALSPALSCGTYFLLETKAPDGFVVGEEAVSVSVVSSAMSTLTLAEVPNEPGNRLPETGGIGTGPVYAAGGVLVLCAALLLVRRSRKGKST